MKFVLIFVLLGTGTLGLSQVQRDPNAPRIEGTVVAYSPFGKTIILVGPSRPGDERQFHEHFLFRLDHDYADLTKGQLIQLKYNGEIGTNPELPREVFQHNSHWTFEATKDNSCASTLDAVLFYTVSGQVYSNMKYTSWAAPLKLPLTTIVPCYVVASGGFVKL